MSQTLAGMGSTKAVSLKPLVFLLLLMGTLTAASDLRAQEVCRYRNLVFDNVDMVTNVTYATDIYNPTKDQNEATLKLDICKPQGDIAPKRPVMIYFHGGHFEQGNKDDEDAVFFCEQFAKAGYVGIKANYRLACNPVSEYCPVCEADPEDCDFAVKRLMALSDMGAVVRWVRYGLGLSNPHKFDKDLIFVGGFGAGAIAANSFAYDNEDLPGNNLEWYSASQSDHSVSGSFALVGTIPAADIDADSVGIHMQFMSEAPHQEMRLVKCNLPYDTTDFLIAAGSYDYVLALDADPDVKVNLTCFHGPNRVLANCDPDPDHICADERDETLLFFYDEIFYPACEMP